VALSKRERYIAIGVGAAVGLFGLDRLVLTPFLDRNEEIRVLTASATDDLMKVSQTKHLRDKVKKDWDAMQAGGMKSDPAEAEAQAQHALRDWYQEAGLSNYGQGASRTTTEGKESKFVNIQFHTNGTGTMASLAKLLWRVETTTIPMRIVDLNITPHGKEGEDNLQIQMTVSTLCALPGADKLDKPSKPGPGRTVAVAGEGKRVQS
jgi:hypothetical protein